MAVVFFDRVVCKDCGGIYGVPLDFHLTVGMDKTPLIGPHKKIGGLLIGILTALIVVFLQGRPYLVGLFMGAGSVLGDAVESFLKRRLKIGEHGPLPILDQIDSPLGAIALTYFWLQPSISMIAAVLAMSVVLVLLVNIISYKLKIKETWW